MLEDAASIGLLEDDFWFSTPRYFAARQDAYISRERESWEQTRFLAYVMAKTVDSKNKIKKPQDLLPFPWDKQVTKKSRVLSAEELEALRKFDEEADLILKKTNPAAYKKYMQEKKKAQKQQNGGERPKHKARGSI